MDEFLDLLALKTQFLLFLLQVVLHRILMFGGEELDSNQYQCNSANLEDELPSGCSVHLVEDHVAIERLRNHDAALHYGQALKLLVEHLTLRELVDTHQSKHR